MTAKDVDGMEGRRTGAEQTGTKEGRDPKPRVELR